MTFTQTSKSSPASTAQYINLQQVPAEEALKHLQAQIKAGSVIAIQDSNGFVMFQTEEALVNDECYNEYEGRTSLRRNCAGQKIGNGDKRRPVANFKTSKGLEGAIWGGFSLSIPVDKK